MTKSLVDRVVDILIYEHASYRIAKDDDWLEIYQTIGEYKVDAANIIALVAGEALDEIKRIAEGSAEYERTLLQDPETLPEEAIAFQRGYFKVRNIVAAIEKVREKYVARS